MCLSIAIAIHGAACASKQEPKEPRASVPLVDGPRRDFEFTTIAGERLSTDTVAGRVTVIAFVATYDVASQAQARFISSVARRHVPRINAAILVLEPPDNLPLVEAFVKTLDLRVPAALADPATIAGKGPFAGLHHVPSIVILDATGHERFRHLGLMVDTLLSSAVRAVQQSAERSRSGVERPKEHLPWLAGSYGSGSLPGAAKTARPAEP